MGLVAAVVSLVVLVAVIGAVEFYIHRKAIKSVENKIKTDVSDVEQAVNTVVSPIEQTVAEVKDISANI